MAPSWLPSSLTSVDLHGLTRLELAFAVLPAITMVVAALLGAGASARPAVEELRDL